MPQLAIPRGWNKRVQSAILQAISLGRHCFFLIVGRMANSPRALDPVVAENERFRHEVELLREELRLKDARMARVPSHRRPQYSPTERLAILQLRAARGWNMAETADRFLLSPTTISSWMERLDEGGESALLQTREPVTDRKFRLKTGSCKGLWSRPGGGRGEGVGAGSREKGES